MMPWLITKPTMILIVTLIVSSIHGTISSDTSHYMNKACQENSSYISGSAFEANLNDTLFTQLLPKASMAKFSYFTMGSGEDQVHALYYCKGDVDDQTCQDCVEAATRKIKDVCKFWKEGVVWFEECTLRYANRNIFSIHEEVPYFKYINNTGIVNDYRLDPYGKIFDSTMDTLVQQAAYGEKSLQGFATKEVDLSSTEIIRGLAQCTADLVGLECEKCLTAALRLRDSWANTMMFLPSCVFRFDLYGKMLAPTHLPPPPTLRAFHIALIVVLPAVFVALAVIVGPRVWKHCSKGHNAPVGVADGEQKVHGLPKYTFPQVEKMTKKFQRQIGEDSYGVVYHGCLLDGSREVAVKMLNESYTPEELSYEIQKFARISHKNLVSVLGYCEYGNRLALIHEYMDNGNLRAFLSGNAASLSWRDLLQIAIDTAEGLHYLHRNCEVQMVHRDVKPNNILLNKNLHAKVTNFGLLILPEKGDAIITTRVIGGLEYLAPEYVVTGMLMEATDVYSFGVVLMELISGMRPGSSDLVERFVKTFNSGDRENLLDARLTRDLNHSSLWGAAELAGTCVEKDIGKRPNMSEILVKLKECLDMVV